MEATIGQLWVVINSVMPSGVPVPPLLIKACGGNIEEAFWVSYIHDNLTSDDTYHPNENGWMVDDGKFVIVTSTPIEKVNAALASLVEKGIILHERFENNRYPGHPKQLNRYKLDWNVLTPLIMKASDEYSKAMNNSNS